MKKMIIIFIMIFHTLISSAQVTETKIKKILFTYQSCFSTLPEIYEINLNEKKVDYISPIIKTSGVSEISTSKKYKKKKWNNLVNLIDKINFVSMDSTIVYGIDGAWFNFDIEYSNGKLKKYKIWAGDVPVELIKFHNLLEKARN
jgi:hypothetical protein